MNQSPPPSNKTIDMVGDEHLIKALAAGDGEALRELFARHAPWIGARLRRAMPAHAVEDVLQETFIAVWRGAKGYRADAAPGAWIWGVARRQAALWVRKNDRPEPGFLEDSRSDGEDAASSIAGKVDLDRALAGLGPEGAKQRELARMIFLEDRSVADAASVLGVPQGTIKSRLYKIRRLLRAALVQGEYR